MVEIHSMSLKLPKFEQFEEGQQIRRSSKAIKSAIVEGYGRRAYKNDFIKFLIYAQASKDETEDHLDTLFVTHSLTDRPVYDSIQLKLTALGKKLHAFIQSVTINHRSEK